MHDQLHDLPLDYERFTEGDRVFVVFFLSSFLRVVLAGATLEVDKECLSAAKKAAPKIRSKSRDSEISRVARIDDWFPTLETTGGFQRTRGE